MTISRKAKLDFLMSSSLDFQVLGTFVILLYLMKDIKKFAKGLVRTVTDEPKERTEQATVPKSIAKNVIIEITVAIIVMMASRLRI